MSEVLGTIKILDGKIITKKEGVIETWSRWTGDENSFIVYDDIRYKLMKSDGESLSKIEKYQDEEDTDDDVSFFRDDF